MFHRLSSSLRVRGLALRCSAARPFHASGVISDGATPIDGKSLAGKVQDEIQSELASLQSAHGADKRPGLAVVLVGAREDSKKYVNMKKKLATKLGFKSVSHILPGDVKQAELMALVDELNGDDSLHGILVQLPLPGQLDTKAVVGAVSEDKDVDGFHPISMGKLARLGEEQREAKKMSSFTDPRAPGPAVRLEEASNVACTPLGCMELVKQAGLESLSGKQVVVLGRSNIVGLPAALLALHLDATVTVCHSKTPDLPGVCRTADVLIAAVGRPEMVRKDWIKPGAVVIDVGINVVDDDSRKSGKRMCGDVHYGEACEVASQVTPVPGGVGPMTVAMLMRVRFGRNRCSPRGHRRDRTRMLVTYYKRVLDVHLTTTHLYLAPVLASSASFFSLPSFLPSFQNTMVNFKRTLQ